MDNYIINQWYFAPILILNAINFGSHAYKNFKEMRDNSTKVLPALYWSTASACAVGLTAICAADGLEKLLK
jgi:hypothetical protein